MPAQAHSFRTHNPCWNTKGKALLLLVQEEDFCNNFIGHTDDGRQSIDIARRSLPYWYSIGIWPFSQLSPILFSHKDYYYCVYKLTLCINDHFDTLTFIIYVINFCFIFRLSIKWWFAFNSLAPTFDTSRTFHFNITSSFKLQI